MPVETLIVGDLMRMTVQLVQLIKARPSDETLLVRVSRIECQPDGTKMLWLENAADERATSFLE